MKKSFYTLSFGFLVLTAFTLNNYFNPKPKYVSVVKKVIPAVVDIQVVADQELHLYIGDQDLGVIAIRKVRVGGSGCYVSSKGFILTCGHLFNFKHIYSINITNSDGSTVCGTLLKTDFKRDLALVKTTFYKTTPFVKLEDPRKTQIGEEVLAVGSPAGFAFSVTNGIISALHRDVGTMYDTVQTNTAINPGNSGGPLFNLKGELVGVVSFFVPVNPMLPVNSGLGFAVSPGQCLEFLVNCGKKIPEIRSYQWFHTLSLSHGNKKQVH
jgi:S1-C subfamily serine protease